MYVRRLPAQPGLLVLDRACGNPSERLPAVLSVARSAEGLHRTDVRDVPRPLLLPGGVPGTAKTPEKRQKSISFRCNFGTYYLKFHTQTDGLSTEYEGRFTEAAGIVMLRMMARGLNMMDRADSVHGLHRPAARVAHPPTAVDYTGQFSMEES